MATVAFLASTNAASNSVSADGVLQWINEIAGSRPFVKKPDFNVSQIAKILQNKKSRDIIYHLVANARSRNKQIEVIGNLFLQKKLSPEEVAYWRTKLPELQLPDLAQDDNAIEPQTARHLIKKQNALREVEQMAEQLMKTKTELMTLSKTANDLNEKLRSTAAGNALRHAYLDQIDAKESEWRRTASELRRRLVFAGARSNNFTSSTQPSIQRSEGAERVNQAAGSISKIIHKLTDNMLEDDLALLKKSSSAVEVTGAVAPPVDVDELVNGLAGGFTVAEIGAALLSNLNKSVMELEAELDRVDVSSEIKELMFDYEPVSGELRDTSPLVVQPASTVMAALTLERESALLKVSSEAAEARMEIHKLNERYKIQMTVASQELKRWLRKDQHVLTKLERYVQLAAAVSGYEQAEKALLSCSQAVDTEIRLLETRNRHASLARSKLASFQKNLEHQIGVIRRLLEAASNMRRDHEAVMAKIGKTIATLPRSPSPVGNGGSLKEAKMDELEDLRSKNLSALYWGFNSSALRRYLSTVGEIFAALPAKSAKHEFSVRLLYLGPTALVSSIRDDMILYRCRVALADRLTAALSQGKSSKHGDEKRIKSVIDQHNLHATQNWERWSEELIQASRDCQQAIDEGVPAYAKLVNDWRVQPGQFAADWVQLDGLPYREYLRNITFLTDSLRQKEEMASH